MSSLLQAAQRLSFICCVLAGIATLAQEPAAKPPNSSPPSDEAAATKPEEKPALPFQIELLQTHVRFEVNGDSRKEVHTIVKINDAGGARQFSRLGFDYNRGFQQVEIPEVKIRHANGGTSEILPSAITDAPNPAVEKFPAYQDVRVKSVRILGLQEGDTLEYRVITTTTKPPLAPDFWLEHTFDRSGQVAREKYELDLPASRFEESDKDKADRLAWEQWLKENAHIPRWRQEYPAELSPVKIGRMYLSPDLTEQAPVRFEDGNTPRLRYSWDIVGKDLGKKGAGSNISEREDPDVVVTTYSSWDTIGSAFQGVCYEQTPLTQKAYSELSHKRGEILGAKPSASISDVEAIYAFVSRQIATVDLPLGSGAFSFRSPNEILESGYGTGADKARLFVTLVRREGAQCGFVLKAESWNLLQIPRPTVFSELILRVWIKEHWLYLDPALDVAPFGMVPATLRGKEMLVVLAPPRPLVLANPIDYFSWEKISDELPFPSHQSVTVDASIYGKGSLTAKVKYVMRGDNELVLREAFHQTPKERWNEVAGLLALSDGFRGEITKVTASDPMETEKPFEVEYEITQPKFVDWSKKPVRIPALLPQIALPDAPGKAASESGGKIELGTPLEVETRLTLRLPEGTAVQTPPGTSVTRDYATYASKYDGHLNTLTASRHVHFLMREIPGERAADYNAFVRAAQIDQAQVITLFPGGEVEKRK